MMGDNLLAFALLVIGAFGALALGTCAIVALVCDPFAYGPGSFGFAAAIWLSAFVGTAIIVD